MTLRSYHLRLGGMAWAFETPAIPLPVSWLRFAGPPAAPGDDAVRVRFDYRPRDAVAYAARGLEETSSGAGVYVAHAAKHPEGGWLEEVLWAGESLIGRRDGAPWAVAIAPAPGEDARAASGWRVALSDVDRPAATRSFFECLAPFVVGAECSRRGGLLFHGNALLLPPEWGAASRPGLRAALIATGPSESGKSTLSRLLARNATRFELLSEDRTILMPRRVGGREGADRSFAGGEEWPSGASLCAFSYPTSGELWLRSARASRKPNWVAGFVFPRRGNDYRCEVLGGEVAFTRIWEQALVALCPGDRASKMVDTILATIEQSPATAYAFMRHSQAAESLESVLGDIFGLRPLVEATRRRGITPF